MAKLFGFSIEDENKKKKGIISPVAPNNEDGADYFLSSGFYGQYVDIEGVFKTEFDIVKRYRDMSLHPECDTAIEHVVNEAIVSDMNDSPVEIDLDNLNIGQPLKKVIRNEFKKVKDLLEFDKKSHEIFRNWYVDGRIFYHKVIDVQKPDEGIQELRYIDALKIKLMRVKPTDKEKGVVAIPTQDQGTESVNKDTKISEFYTYYPQGVAQKYGSVAGKGIRISKDAICHVHSGLVDRNKKITLSYLHKAIKGLNQLRMIEDSLVIYRLSRAPERRIFYIDVGNLPKIKAEQYLRDVMARYRNKLVYDASTGEIRDDKKHMSMLEDFWLPRREGGRGTEITTLPGGQNLGELKDVEYFRKKLYNSLNLPPSRLTDDNKGFNLGKTTEVLRDELKFTKFIGRLRKRFGELFHDILKTQLILKGVITPEDWDDMQEHIQFDYLFDNHFNELKELEMVTQRMAMVTQMDPFVGKYFSIEHIRRDILQQQEKEYKELDKQMKAEIAAGLSMDPIDVTTLDTMERQNVAYQPEIDAQSQDNQAALDQARADDDHKKELQKIKAQPKPQLASASKPKKTTK